MTWKELQLTGWGRSSRATVRACRPERWSSAIESVTSRPEGGMIPFGGGRSYGDAALNDGGHAMLTERLDRVLSFDAEKGELVCEAGATIAGLHRWLIPKGFLLPSIPGTGFATIGGAVANDVHGKNHDRHGGFGDHILWIDLLLADGSIRRVSAADDDDLFAATIGGLGLTGLILAVCVDLLPVASNAVDLRERRVRDLDEYFELLEDARRTATYSVGWIDALAQGKNLGRGILETAEVAADGVPADSGRSRKMPFDLPGIALNRWSIGAFNALYLRRVGANGRSRRVEMSRFFHPLDGIHEWNRMYGRTGFHQFQCVIPDAAARSGIETLLSAASAARAGSFLAVLKTLGAVGKGHLSFPLPGYTLALDFPVRAGIGELMMRLEAITLDHGGRIYLAKDSCLSANGFATMYPKLDAFRKVIQGVDPDGLFVSDLARRLHIREGGK